MSLSEGLREHRVSSQSITLNVLELGAPSAPPVLMLHGLRDTAHALVPMAAVHLADRYRVLIMELRGHGASDTSDAYAMPDFLLDVYAVSALADAPVHLFGHSLGGHLATRYAALFPERVRTLAIVEGLGPPRRPHEGDEALEVAAYRNMLLRRTQSSNARPIADLADVAARLKRNNPRLDPDEAERLAPHLVRQVDRGFRWAFDSRASSVFIGGSEAQNTAFAHQVQAPTCIVSGALSDEYWGREMAHGAPTDGSEAPFTGRFAEGELEARAARFRNYQHHWFERSGHMVHYDEPERLGRLLRGFLEDHDV